MNKKLVDVQMVQCTFKFTSGEVLEKYISGYIAETGKVIKATDLVLAIFSKQTVKKVLIDEKGAGYTKYYNPDEIVSLTMLDPIENFIEIDE